MLQISGYGSAPFARTSRRGFLRIGSLGLGGIGMDMLSLPDLLRLRALGAAADSRKSVILIWLNGGMSHHDTYDMKPDAPAEIRGEFRPIGTNVSGVFMSEHLPMQSRIMDKLAIVRSCSHNTSSHPEGAQLMLTGWVPPLPATSNLFPSIGSVVSRMKGANEPGMPAYVNLPKPLEYGNAAYLGLSYSPFSPNSDPNKDDFKVPNLKLNGHVDLARLDRRQRLLKQFDGIRRDVDTNGDIRGLDTFYRDAFEMVTNEKAQQAFDLKSEPTKLRDEYGRTEYGQSCLLARRLVEAGVTFVAIQCGTGWDTHSNNFPYLKANLPSYDRAVAALVTDLYQRGLQNDVLVMAMSDFGRSPRVQNGGRDHWPQAGSMVFAGGGLRMGQVVGATNEKGEFPTTKPLSPGCLLSTMYHVLGIDHRHVFHDQANRPLPILNEGQPIEDLI